MTEAAGLPRSSGVSVCNICHLPVAQLRRAGEPHANPHACPFCDKTFGRVDGARRHAKSCPRRQNRSLPPEAKRGRKLRACDQCSRVKAQCDGRRPCGHCASREPRLNCTFSRFCSDSTHRQHDEGSREVPLDGSDARRPGRKPNSTLSFLFKLTDPGGDSVLERAIADEPESNVPAPAIENSSRFNEHLDMNINSGLNLHFDDCIDPSLLFTSLMDPCLDAEAEIGFGAGAFSFEIPQQDDLTLRVAQLSAELEAIASAKPNFGAFDRVSFDVLFTPSRVHYSAQALSRKRHFQFPLIHWPTFEPDKACLPLILAVTLTGAIYSRQSDTQDDDLARFRDYYVVADAYIFKRLKRCMETFVLGNERSSASDLQDAIGHLQAGLLVIVLTISVNDADMRRTVIFKRLPTLVTALRLFGLVGSRHDSGEQWEQFARKEACIRLVAWTFFMDCLTTVFCNKPPLMVQTEICGHLPCSHAVWNAGSADDFEAARSADEKAGVGFLHLNILTVGLLRDDWDKENIYPFEKLNFYHLNAIICALQPIIFNLHTLPLPDTTSSILLRALDRWKMLWDAATNRADADQRRWLGVERNSPGLALLSRRIIEVNQTEDGKKSKYLQRIPKHDFSDAHDFIREYC